MAKHSENYFNNRKNQLTENVAQNLVDENLSTVRVSKSLSCMYSSHAQRAKKACGKEEYQWYSKNNTQIVQTHESH